MTNKNMLEEYAGKNSYPAILNSVNSKLLNSDADSIKGKEILSEAFKNFNESTTPILTLKEFTTNAEQFAPHDAKLTEIVNSLRKTVKSGDMNFLINVCKEEHYRNLSRTGIDISNDKTIADIENQFIEPESVIVKLIQKGIFDKLESNLLMEIKSDLPASNNKIVKDVQIDNLNESTYFGNNIYAYTPVGIGFVDTNKSRNILLLEHNQFIVANDGAIIPLNESISIPAAHQRLSEAINELPYNIENETFSLAADWDFELDLFNNGKVGLTTEDAENGVYVEPEYVQQLLIESLQLFESNGKFSNKSVRDTFVRDADNFVMLMENYDKLIQADKLLVVKNVDNNDTVILNESQMTPTILLNNVGLSSEYNSFSRLNESLINVFNIDTTKLFENSINHENVINNTKTKLIVALNESQKTLNNLIDKSNSLLNLAEVDSPAFHKLNESINVCNERLDKNIELSLALNSMESLYESTMNIANGKTIGFGVNTRNSYLALNPISKALFESCKDLTQITDDSLDATENPQDLVNVLESNLEKFQMLNQDTKSLKNKVKKTVDKVKKNSKEIGKVASKAAKTIGKDVASGTAMGVPKVVAAKEISHHVFGTKRRKGDALHAAKAGAALGAAGGLVSGTVKAAKEFTENRTKNKPKNKPKKLRESLDLDSELQDFEEN